LEIREYCMNILEQANVEPEDYILRELKSAVIKYNNTPKRYLSETRIAINGIKYANLLESLTKEDDPVEILIKFVNPKREGWRYDLPTERLKFTAEGKGAFLGFQPDREGIQAKVDAKGGMIKTVAMFRTSVTRYYYPDTIEARTKREPDVPPPHPPILASFKEHWEFVKENGMIPLELRICAYTPKERFVYRLDLVKGRQIMDFREGLVPYGSMVKHSPLHLLYLDRALSSNKLPELQKKVLEIAFESKGTDPGQIANIFEINATMASNHLAGLARRKLLKPKGTPPAAFYVADLEGIAQSKGYI